jgi:Rrf2 family transcriptional regulator, nitric oxide-sensitive transcriptional repressor
MKLTTYSDYSLRVLIYLAVRDDSLATIGKIAESYDISRNHLMKVVHHLGVLGYLETVRGKNGGVRLAMAPEDINIGALLRETEDTGSLVECFNPDGSCAIENACALRGMLHQALAGFFAVLDEFTLADMLRNRGRLKNLLST